MENIIKSRLLNSMNQHNILSKNQYSLIAKSFTTRAAIRFLEVISENMENSLTGLNKSLV